MDLNVCLMNDSFPPTIDGVANAVLNYAQNITDAGERCAVVTPAYPDVKDDYRFPVVRYPSLNTTQLTGYRAGVPFAPETIVRLADMQFDLVHTHCPIASTVLARSLRDACPMPVVFTYHTKFDIDIANAIRSEKLQQVAVDLLVCEGVCFGMQVADKDPEEYDMELTEPCEAALPLLVDAVFAELSRRGFVQP